jgi:DeoR family transcriptional regulator, fructose operon transcriptional repressor
LSLARQRGSVNVSLISQEIGVSVETVRRDLAVLERQGLIRREYGSAFPVESVAFETDLDRRSQTLLAEKRRIADFAVEQLNDAESVFVACAGRPWRPSTNGWSTCSASSRST